MTGVEKIEEFLREQRLRWFGHMDRMDDEKNPVKAKHFLGDGIKKGRPKKRWKKVVEKDMLATSLTRTDVQNHSFWRLSCENRLISARRENKLGSRRVKILIYSPGKNG